MMKKLTVILLVALLVAAALPTGFAAESLSWEFNGVDTLTITGSGAMTNYTSESPAPWASYATDTTRIIIGEGVTSIGSNAFAGFVSVRSVSLPGTLTGIGDFAFQLCGTLNNLSIPGSVTTIGSYAFLGCKALTSLTIPGSVTTIGDGAFSGCTGITTLTIGSGVTTIGKYAFHGCSGLTAVTIPAGVTAIGDSAFEECTGLTAFSVNASNTAYASDSTGTLYNKAMTTLIRVPNTLQGDYAIPAGVTTVSAYAFYGCSGITGIHISSAVASIGKNAFGKCTAISGFWVDSANTRFWNDAYGALYNKSKSGLYFVPKTLSGSYTTPSATRILNDYAFQDCTGISNVIIPGSVISILPGTFEGCTGLRSIDMPDNLGAIHPYAFYGCTSLTDITFPQKTFAIAREAFSGCTALTKIRFTGDVCSLRTLSFQGVTATVEYPQYNTTWASNYLVSAGGNLTWQTFHEHTYTETAIPATCQELAKVRYTCACGHTKTGYAAMSDWSTTKPTLTPSMVETKTQYRHRDYTNFAWTAWFDWRDMPITADVTRDVESRLVYRYANGSVGGHSYVDGKCSVCGVADPNYGNLTITGKSFSLSFEDEILVNFYFAISGETEKVTDQGMLVFYTKPTTISHRAADEIYAKTTYSAANDLYLSTTDGIAAKCMGDSRYYVAYATLTNGNYVYSAAYEYSPRKYAENMLGRASTSQNQKALCVAMLNYGAAAQTYFGYNTGSLMNANLTAEQKAMAVSYSPSLFTGAVAPDSSKAGNFVKSATGFSSRSATVSFEGAFGINFYFTPSESVDDVVTFYYWSASDYAAASTLKTNNATGKIVMVEDGAGTYWAQVEGIAAKQLDHTYYVAGVYTSNTQIRCTGIIGYSLSRYCMNNASGTDAMAKLAAATAVYGYHAKIYFAG